MRRLRVFALFLFSSAAWGADGPAFHFKAPVPGTKGTVTSNDTMELALQGPFAGKGFKMRRSKVYEMEILEADDKTETKVRVHFLVAEDTKESQGKVDRKVKPFAGKTYIVTSTAGGLEILGEGGGAPPQEELALLKKELGSVGKPDQTCLSLDGKRLKAGEAVDPSLLGPMQGSIVESDTVDPISVQLREIHTRSDGILVGLFDLKWKAKSNQEKRPQITMSLTGSMEIGLDPCRLLSLDVAGPISAEEVVESKGQMVSLQATGTAQINIQAQHK